jgi:acyl dehydratase
MTVKATARFPSRGPGNRARRPIGTDAIRRDIIAEALPTVDREDMADTTFEDRLQALVGQPVSDGGPTLAPDPVNQPMIRHWAAAFEDANPVYTDPEAAARSRFGQIVAPPLMLQTWTMATPKITGMAERGGSPVEGGRATIINVLDEAGFVGTLASNSEFEILRYLRLGDIVSAATVLDAVSPEKQTRIGPGHFITWVTTYTDQDGEVVGRQTFRILKFKPGGVVS